ncbi:hypothetical protein pdam_00023364 [Pocillopora damicornis]|uniref:Apple domain-containing protein n=1 Tax=Pocillopora damicornis TaxID=46731 RepID=A0A3M6UA17_POCDA|nr:hypothetical protein pdam_00023364 [Pocillopora damicornis]
MKILSKLSLSLLSITVLWVGWFHCPADGNEDFGCRSLRFKRSEGERAPQRYVFKESYLPMGKELMTHDCRYECLMESNCLSVNIGPPNKTGFRLCQLSNFDHIQHREDKEIRKGFILWASELREETTCFGVDEQTEYLILKTYSAEKLIFNGTKCSLGKRGDM